MKGVLKHYGMPRRSGRYPWGSGDNPYQNAIGFRAHVEDLRKQGFTEKQIAEFEGIKTTQLRARISISNAEMRAAQRAEVVKLRDRGHSPTAIGRMMGINESTVRSLLDPVLAERAAITQATAKMLKESVDEKRFIDIGSGVENSIGVSRTKLNTAVAELQEQGYKVHTVNQEQVGIPGQFTILKALGTPETEWKELVRNPEKMQLITDYSDDYGRTFTSNLGLQPIQNVDSSRIMVRYGDEGGRDKDGVIELRRDTPDLDMGQSHYAQVRIGVDGTHYLKGMAIYGDNMPEGVDIIFNTNKSKKESKLDAMKKLKDDPDNPFGSTIKTNGQRGALNIVNEEGDWETWSRTISSQILSKQTPTLAKAQLDLALSEKQEEYAEIMALTNPTIRQQLLIANGGFADTCDSAASHLKAAALPRQASKVILPVPEMKPTEVYAPTFNDGEVVVLIRHPHGGRFEIPQLVVNNKNPAAKRVMENAIDAIGIHPSVAQKLSGADFDGDAVIIIPNNKGLVKNAPSLKGLQNFDPISAYPGYEGMKPIAPATKQTKMGEVSNLITDMTIKGASFDEIARAVRHSMVVIDAEKHNLNYKQSYIDHGIAALSARYQRGPRGGASTLVSQASSEVRVDHRKTGYRIDPKTGARIYTETGQSYTDKKGKVVMRKSKITKMDNVDDARELSSGRPIEEIYASYANNLKALANLARRVGLATEPTPYSPSAKKAYQKEVDSLNAQLNVALKNRPIERQAQILASSVVKRKMQANPGLDNDDIKKLKNQALAEARARTGAAKTMIKISDREWEAIQAGAISASKLKDILNNTDMKRIKELATPRQTSALSPARLSRAKTMLASGYTQAQVADALGVSTSTLQRAVK